MKKVKNTMFPFILHHNACFAIGRKQLYICRAHCFQQQQLVRVSPTECFCERDFSRLLGYRSYSDNCIELGLFEELHFWPSSSCACKTLVLHGYHNCEALTFKAMEDLSRGKCFKPRNTFLISADFLEQTLVRSLQTFGSFPDF